MAEFFAKAARNVSGAVGSPYAFVVAVSAVIAWVISGPAFGYSPTWQLVINTGTTIVTFLMVFIIQNAQNRDQKAIQLKLNELLRAVAGAETGFVNLENMDDATLAGLGERFADLHERHAGHTSDGQDGETTNRV